MHEDYTHPIIEAFAHQQTAYKRAVQIIALWRPVLKKELIELSHYLEKNGKFDLLVDLFNSNETNRKEYGATDGFGMRKFRRVYVIETELKGHVME